MAYSDGESRNAATEIAKSLDKRLPRELPTMTNWAREHGQSREMTPEEQEEFRLAVALEKWDKQLTQPPTTKEQ